MVTLTLWMWLLPMLPAAALAVIVTVLVMDHRHQSALDAEFDQGWDMCAASICAQLAGDTQWEGPPERPARGRHAGRREAPRVPPPADGTDWRPMRAWLRAEFDRIAQPAQPRRPSGPAAAAARARGAW